MESRNLEPSCYHMVTVVVPWAAVCLDDHLVAGWPQLAVSGTTVEEMGNSHGKHCLCRLMKDSNQQRQHITDARIVFSSGRGSYSRKGAAIALAEGADQCGRVTPWSLSRQYHVIDPSK